MISKDFANIDAETLKRAAKLGLREDGDDLALGESGFLHVEAPWDWILYFRLDQDFEEAS